MLAEPWGSKRADGVRWEGRPGTASQGMKVSHLPSGPWGFSESNGWALQLRLPHRRKE